MNYYLIAPLKRNLRPLVYKSHHNFQANEIAQITLLEKPLLGIVLCAVEKPDFECEEARKSDFILSESQVILGDFIAKYYCVSTGIAFGILTLGKNSPLGMQFRTCENFGDFADAKSSLNPKNSHKHKNHTANARIVNSNANSAELSLRGRAEVIQKNYSDSRESCESNAKFCYFERSEKYKNFLTPPPAPPLKNGRGEVFVSFGLFPTYFFKKKVSKKDLDFNDSYESQSWGFKGATPPCLKSSPRRGETLISPSLAEGARGWVKSQNLNNSCESNEILPTFSKSRCGIVNHILGRSPALSTPPPPFGNGLGGGIENSSDSRESNTTFAPPKLSPKQQDALDFILSHDKTLLFGDTGSGKTEIYINAICATLARGQNTLFLMPEIALTPQMEARLKRVFGDLVCIWHSKVSVLKKREILSNLHSIKIIAGARSALFLPLENVGLIIIDEEHDEAYKSNTNPRYNARDLAIFLAKKQKIRLILGSATPSLNSYYNFSRENAIFRLKGGYFDGKKEIIFDSDLENVPQSLLSKIATARKNQKQSIVFVPIRGNFKVLQCESCGSGVKCKHCSINMSLHSKKNALICHYCGYAEPFFYSKTKCKICDSRDFKALKIGTQEVFKTLSAHFPHAKIAIFDRDEVKSDARLRKILSDFNAGKIDILIGTQMISKGHDYHNVALVGILGIDNVLNSSDFRAYERAVSLLFQISGRCGRKNDGEVLINTQNRAFFTRFLNDYEDFLRFELENRTNLYPPFMRLALICAQNKSEGKAKEILQTARKIVESAHRNIEIVGLNKAPIEQIGGLWRYFMLVRAKSAKELLTALTPLKDMPLSIDIDPQQIF